MVLLAAITTVALALGAGMTLRRLFTQPEWWREGWIEQPARAAIADSLDNGAWTALTSARELKDNVSEPWVVTLSGRDASAWLAERLEPWLKNQREPIILPPSVKEIQVAFVSGAIRVGVSLRDEQGEHRWITLSAAPKLTRQGLMLGASNWESMILNARGERVIDALAETELGRVLSDRTPLLRDGCITLPDGRRVRVQAIEIENDRLTLTCRTELNRSERD